MHREEKEQKGENTTDLLFQDFGGEPSEDSRGVNGGHRANANEVLSALVQSAVGMVDLEAQRLGNTTDQQLQQGAREKAKSET